MTHALAASIAGCDSVCVNTTPAHPVHVRPACEADMPAIAAIAAHAVRTGVAHFGEVPDPPEVVRAAWLATRARHPWFVAEHAGEVIGYAKGGEWNDRAAYRWTSQIGIYINPAHHGRGVGKALYAALIPELETRGFRTVYAGVVPPNPASERLHERIGMSRIGTLPAAGYKHGAWHDVVLFAMRLGDPESPPPSDRPPPP